MGFSRKALKAMGLADEQVDSIVELHTEVVDALKSERDDYKAKADKLTGVEKELDALKAKGDDGYKEKYEKERKAFDDYKAEVTAKETKAAKESAAKAYFEGKNITGANLEIALRGAKEEIGALELDGDKIKDTAALDALVNGTFAGLVVSTRTTGAKTATPPQNTGGTIMTRDEIFKKDERGHYVHDTATRQRELGKLIEKGN